MSGVVEKLTGLTSSAESAREPVRVLHVVNGEYYSGAERVQDLLALALPETGFGVDFACLKPLEFPRLRRCQETPLYELPMRSRLDLAVSGRLATLVRERGHRLIHAHTPRTALLGSLASLRTGVPFVYHVHSPTCRDSTNRMRNWVNSQIEWLSLRRASHLIAVSTSLGSHMRRLGYADDQITVVRNGVPTPSRMRDARPPGAEWSLGTVALFRPRKGLEVLLTALAQMRAAGLPVRLRAVGAFESEEYRTAILRRVQGLELDDCIDWVGFCRDVDEELAKLDVMILPSLFGEGLPMVVLEAMAAGVPVVASRVEGVPEALDDGVQGLMVRPGDPHDLAVAVQRIVRGEIDWNTLRENAISHHRAHFSERCMAGGVANAYRALLDAQPPHARRPSLQPLFDTARRLVLRK